MAVFSMAGSNPAAPTYPLQRSVRLRSSASASFTRTPATSGNRQIFTISFWLKRGTLGGADIFDGNNANGFIGSFRSDYTLYLYDLGAASGGFQIYSARVFRDPSAWYHIVIAVDTTQATDTNRIKVYINGVQENLATWTLGAGASRYPSLNANFDWNNTNQHKIGYAPSGNGYFDGYITEFNNVSGYQLDATSFGAYNSYGVWSPTKYTGTYGTNGFYLNFQDNSALTTTANVGIGKDSSGNGNYWTSNNISITAGTTYDSMLDVPTLTSNTNSNYPTLSPLQVTAASIGTLSNANLSWSCGASGTYGKVYGTMSLPSTGQYYWEVTAGSTANLEIGIISAFDQTTFYPGYSAVGYTYYQNTGNKTNNNVSTAYGASYTTNDVIGVAFDATAGTLTFYKNNVSQGTAFTSLTGTYVPTLGNQASGASTSASINFGQRPFTYTPPTGYNRLCTYNLPDSIVPVGAQYMAATTYTSTGTTQSLTNTVNGFSMQPDLVWQKVRSVVGDHYLIDSVRGASNVLSSNTTAAAGSSPTFLTSFNSNGWTQGTGNYTAGATIVGWQWRASNASAVTNTNGALTSQVSVNQSAGFSIVTWTGNGTGGTTVGHGLSALPQFVIIKKRSTTGDWYVASYASGQGLNYAYHLFLNTTGALSGSNDPYYMGTQTSLTSNVLQLAAGNPNNGGNENGTTYVAYCWTPVPGFSKFGSYTGNGSTDGPFVFTNFRPRWILLKLTSSAGGAWYIYDTSRNTYNVMDLYLRPDASDAETTFTTLDSLSNGFKVRTTNTQFNGSGSTYIYAAFAENPFKNALAR